MTLPQQNLTYKSLNKPLNILGVERRLFFGSLVLGAATFCSFSSLLGGIIMFALLFALARITTKTDPQMLHIVINAASFKVRYDPAKRDVYRVKEGM